MTQQTKPKKLMFRQKRTTLAKKKSRVAYIFLIPWFIGVIVFFLPPFLDSVFVSFFDFSLDRQSGLTFIGFTNYISLFRPSEAFITTFVNTLIELAYTIPITVIFSLFIALILNSKFVGRGIVRTIFFMPLILGLGIISFAITNNAVNSVLDHEVTTSGELLGLFSVNIMSDFFVNIGIPQSILNPITSSINSIFTVISFSGVQILLFLAALQSIDKTLFDVAQVEGANAYESFWKITFPMVIPQMKTVVIFTIIDAIARSEVVYHLSYNMGRYSGGIQAAGGTVIILLTLTLLGVTYALFSFYKGGVDNVKK